MAVDGNSTNAWYFPILSSHDLNTGYQIAIGIIVGLSAIEYILYVIAFLYCLIRTFPSQGWGGRALIPVVSIAFLILRAFSMPLLIANLPLPRTLGFSMPCELREFARGRAKFVFAEGDLEAPMVVVIVPVFNELPQALLATVVSVAESKYPKQRLHLILAFDDDSESPLYCQTLKSLGYNHQGEAASIIKTARTNDAAASRKDSTTKPILDIEFRKIKVTVCRFPHGGKRQTQARAYELAEHQYIDKRRGQPPHKGWWNRTSAATVDSSSTNDFLFLFVDSDVVINENAIAYFVDDFLTHPKRMAVTGLVLCAYSRTNLWWLLQETEYVQSQMLDRCLEAACGGVTCLPGALTMVRYRALKKIAPLYFGHLRSRINMDDFEYARFHLGEDRYMTHLLMASAQSGYQLGFVERAVCKTEAPDTFPSLLKQRRRWFLGALVNEVCMLTTPRLWRRHPFLMLIRLLHDSLRSVSALQYLFLISLILEYAPIWLIIVAFALPLVLNWACMCYVGIKLHRYKVLLYPLMHVLHPVLQWIFTVYAIVTFRKRTWGGPRTGDRGQEAAEQDGEEGFNESDIICMYSEEYNRDIYLPRNRPLSTQPDLTQADATTQQGWTSTDNLLSNATTRTDASTRDAALRASAPPALQINKQRRWSELYKDICKSDSKQDEESTLEISPVWSEVLPGDVYTRAGGGGGTGKPRGRGTEEGPASLIDKKSE
ncbi:hypothetical protein HK104_004180 [Borealophlyctis nickersoniae]|nr:hypothetical protein HK104_004180 [Borealophlyctis nickersoniae]